MIYGIKTIRINNDGEINQKIKDVLKYKGPVVCDANCKEFQKYEPKIIGWGTPIEDMYPYLPRKEFKKNMYIKPLNNWINPFMPSDSVKKGTMELK